MEVGQFHWGHGGCIYRLFYARLYVDSVWQIEVQCCEGVFLSREIIYPHVNSDVS